MEIRGGKDKRISQIKDNLPGEVKSTILHTKPAELSREHLSSVRMFFVIIVSVFLAEVVAMILIFGLPHLPYQYLTLIDAGIMIILISPVLYLLSFRPLIQHINKSQQAEVQLREMALFPTLNPDALLQVDANGRIRKVNPAAAQFGFSAGAMLIELIPDLLELDLQGCIANGTTQEISETQFGERVLLWTVRGVPELELAFLYSKDITERKAIERHLRIQTTAMKVAANGILITDRQGNIQWVNPALLQMTGYESRELMGQNTRIFNSGLHEPAYYRHMWDTVLSGQVWQGETTNKRKNGSLFIEEQTITPVRGDSGQISHFIAIKQDITERKQAEKELEQRNVELQIISNAERNQRQFSEALVAAALILNRSLKLNDVLPLILEQIREVIPYQLADIALIDGDSFYDASHQGDRGWPPNLAGMNNRFLVESFPIFIKVRQSGEPVLIADTRQEPDWITAEAWAWARSFLSAPLLVENKVIGFVNLFGEQPGFFTQEMSNRLVAFAAHASVVIQNAWLFEQVQASTERLQSLSRRLVEIQENERLYISRELHDEAGQVLTSLLVDLRLLEKNISKPDNILKIIAEMESSLNGVIENLHRIAMSLRPASLDHLGLVAALRQHVEAVGEKNGLRVNFRCVGVEERLPVNVETVLYRTVQEALTNVVRHSHATQVDVVLTVRDGKLIVIVEDDGVGFDPNTVSTDDHIGLFGIRERTEMINGTLIIESAPGKGTTIMMEVDYADTAIGRR